MKKALYIILSAALSSACNSISFPFVKFGGMKGDVESVVEKDYYAEEKFGIIGASGEPYAMRTMKYDRKGRLVAFEEKSNDKVTFSGEYEYDGEICVKSSYWNDYQGHVSMKAVEIGDDHIKRVYTEENGTQYVEHTYFEGLVLTYKSAGQKSEEVCNEKGMILERKIYNGDDVRYRCTYEYDEDGLMSKETYWFENNRKDETVYKYEDFDKEGNWTKRISYLNGEPDKVTLHEITYR